MLELLITSHTACLCFEYLCISAPFSLNLKNLNTCTCSKEMEAKYENLQDEHKVLSERYACLFGLLYILNSDPCSFQVNVTRLFAFKSYPIFIS